jgi:hypothetical protein
MERVRVIGGANLIQIRRNTTPEPMPAIPIDSDCFH